MSDPLEFTCPRCGLSGTEVRAEEQRHAQIAALLDERDGYRRSGRDAQAKEVEAELERLGHSEKGPRRPAPAAA